MEALPHGGELVLLAGRGTADELDGPRSSYPRGAKTYRRRGGAGREELRRGELAVSRGCRPGYHRRAGPPPAEGPARRLLDPVAPPQLRTVGTARATWTPEGARGGRTPRA